MTKTKRGTLEDVEKAQVAIFPILIRKGYRCSRHLLSTAPLT
jgi:hypothetical protein